MEDDRARMKTAAEECMDELAVRHDITDRDRLKVGILEGTARQALEDWLFAAFKISHT